MQEFEVLLTLMDPSRNMKTYRQLLLNSPPPMIPFSRTTPSLLARTGALERPGGAPNNNVLHVADPARFGHNLGPRGGGGRGTALLMKDLFFVNDCNASRVNDLVNFDKLRLMASIIRFMDAFRYVRYDQMNEVGRVGVRRFDGSGAGRSGG